MAERYKDTRKGAPAGPACPTLLEYVLTRLVGPPRGRYYPCPFGDHRDPYQVVVNEPMTDPETGQPFDVKGRCYRGCGPGPAGCFDACDVIAVALGVRRYADQLVVREDLRRAWRAGLAAAGAGPVTSLPMGSRRARGALAEAITRWGWNVPLAWADLMSDLAADGVDEEDGYGELADALLDDWFAPFGEVAQRRAGDLLDYWRNFREWRDGADIAHRAECRDPACDWWCCRRARGWTDGQIDAANRRDRDAYYHRRDAERRAFDAGVAEILTQLRNGRRG